MIHAAQVDENGRVARVIVAPSIAWCESNLGGTWVETKTDGSIRGFFAGPGFIYDSDTDNFLPPETETETP